MYAITGVTGQVGGAMARALLQAGHGVRAILRDESKAAPWRALGAEVAIAGFGDVPALSKAFSGMDGVFVMVAPDFAPEPGYPGARRTAAAHAEALAAARPGKVVALSSVGGQHDSGLGLITQVRILEDALAGLDLPVAVLRPAWFMENSLWDIVPARETGTMPSFLTPLDRPYPMVATADIGQVGADALTQSWTGHRVIEIEGPRAYMQTEIAALLGAALEKTVTAQPVPREDWESLFKSQGTAWPQPRIDMIDGFNSGWIAFEPGRHEHIIGATPYETVLADLAKRA